MCLNKESKRQLWNSLDELVQTKIPPADKISLTGDLNVHVEKEKNMYKRFYSGRDFKNRKDFGEVVFDFSLENGFGLVNTIYKK